MKKIENYKVLSINTQERYLSSMSYIHGCICVGIGIVELFMFPMGLYLPFRWSPKEIYVTKNHHV